MNLTDFAKNPLNKIIGLSVILSMGFLMVILAAISGNWFPILDGILFGVAYLPVIISRVAWDSSDYDFSFDPLLTSSLAIQEMAKFLTALLTTLAFVLPILLHHSKILTTAEVVLTLVGGVLIFRTIYTFSKAFEVEDSGEDLPTGVI